MAITMAEEEPGPAMATEGQERQRHQHKRTWCYAILRLCIIAGTGEWIRCVYGSQGLHGPWPSWSSTRTLHAKQYGSTREVEGILSAGCGRRVAERSEGAQSETEDIATAATFTGSFEAKIGSMDDFSPEHPRSCTKGEAKIRRRDTGARKGHCEYQRGFGQGNERRTNPEGGDACSRPRSRLHGLRDGQATGRQETRYRIGRDAAEDICGTAALSTSGAGDADADAIHGADDPPTRDSITGSNHSATSGRTLSTTGDTGWHSTQRTSGTLCPQDRGIWTLSEAEWPGQAGGSHCPRRFGVFGWLWPRKGGLEKIHGSVLYAENHLVGDVGEMRKWTQFHYVTTLVAQYGFHSLLASYAGRYSTSFRGVARPFSWDRGPYYIMEGVDYQEDDMEDYKHEKYGITSMANLHRRESFDWPTPQCSKIVPPILFLDEMHIDDNIHLGLLQWTVRLSTIAMAMSWEDTFFQGVMQRQQVQVFFGPAPASLTWDLVRQQARLPSPQEEPRLQIFRSSSPVFRHPNWLQVQLGPQTTPLDVVARITRAWNDLIPWDGRNMFWRLFLADRRVRISASVISGHSVHILISAQEERQLGEMVVVLIDIYDLTTTPVSSTIRAFTVERYQNRNTVLQEAGIQVQCATTHICRAWRNGAPVRLSFSAWEHADYIMVQLQERTAYGPIVDLLNSPQGNEVETPSAGTEAAPSVDETTLVATEEVPSTDGIAQGGTEAAPSTDEVAHGGFEEAPSVEETEYGLDDDANPCQDFLVVTRRPRINYPTDQFLVYVGDREAAAQARRQWRLDPLEPRIQEVHRSFYTSFPEDAAWTVYLAIEAGIFGVVPHMRGAMLHLRKYGQRDYQAVFIARSTSELGILSYCHILHTCKATENNKCVVTHNNRRVHGASPVLIEHGDYIRVELMRKDNLMETAILLSTMEEDYTQSDRSAFWPARRMTIGQAQQGTRQMTRTTPVGRMGAQSLHEAYWFAVTIFIWIFVPMLIILHQQDHPTPKVRRRHKREGGIHRRRMKTLFFCSLLLLQHCHGVSALQTRSFVETSSTTQDIYLEKYLAMSQWAAQDTWQLDHFQGLRPPGNPKVDDDHLHTALTITDHGRYLLDMIAQHINYEVTAHQIRERLLNAARPLRALRNIEKAKPQILSLERALFHPPVDCTDDHVPAQMPIEHTPACTLLQTKGGVRMHL